MPDTNDGPADGSEKSAPAEKVSPFAGFAASMTAGLGLPNPDAGEPDGEKAVETVADAKAPEAAKETPDKGSDADKAKPSVAKSVNFEGLSDDTKTYWETALKAGHATPADVERARMESLLLSKWSKDNLALKASRKELEAERAALAKQKDDLALLEKIRGSKRHLDAWEKMTKGELPSDESDEELADRKSARQIAREEFEALEAAKAAKDAKDREQYEAREKALQEVVTDQIGELGVTPQVMNGYLKALEAKAPRGVDPVLHFTPAELLHELSVAHRDAEIATLRAQLDQKASRVAQAAKQSLSPPGRTTEPPKNGLKKVMSEMGVARLSDIAGFGWPAGHE